MIGTTARRLIGATALAVMGMAGAALAFPDGPVTYIIPFNAGGESDITARYQQQPFQKITGQDLIVQYLPGAGGAQAWAGLNGMPGDGQTIMGTNLPHIVLQPMLQDPGYKTEDIANVYMFHFTPDALLVRADSPYQTLQDVIDAAKKMPGGITAGGTATNSANHVANQLFANASGAELTYIPYTGTGATESALVGGEVDVLWGYTTVAVRQGDAVRPLAIATEERHPLFPDTPTFKELGIDMVGGAYRGIGVPSSTPEDVRQQLSDIIGQVNADPAFRTQMENDGYAVIDVPYADMDAFMAERTAAYTAVAEQLRAQQ
ncbi:tripartite tricarboxylate transporter substrate binding protein [Paracoccus sediminis]|uniref:Tripartite tricarboxylate transporter substrate binding protein n=1 Tax=Paracoccus sediminis TaxID=1214787 RepID=A0A238WR69_9RHOB|nr:tripartite tricarboxylate transporter substrate binding protein [Paracoccus sediminis]TBN50369.1 tripartite tricarboxylate transporter substrate binding protein [Paracoccus sediminis]SNR48908.1 Tripartite-type tricarboxylate transporter, receptor component TctC [Paracoccus sediminis]